MSLIEDANTSLHTKYDVDVDGQAPTEAEPEAEAEAKTEASEAETEASEAKTEASEAKQVDPLTEEQVRARRQLVRDCLLERARQDWEKRVVQDGKRYRHDHPEMAEMLDRTKAKLVLEGSDDRTRAPTDLATVVRAFNYAHAKSIEYLKAHPGTTDADANSVRDYVLDGNEHLQKFALDHPRGFALLVTPSFVTNPGQIEMMRNLIINQAMG